MDIALFNQVSAVLVQTTTRDAGSFFPLPSYLQQTINKLAVALVRNQRAVPTGLPDWFKLFETPIADWWPSDIPVGVSSHRSFLYDGTPEDWLVEYLEESGWTKQAPDQTQWQFQIELDQLEMRSLHRWCREQQQPQIYRTVREFVVRNPFTTKDKWLDLLAQFALRLPITPATFYEEVGPLHQHQSRYWICPYCGGLLKWTEGRARCVNHSVCGRLTANYREPAPIALAASYQPHNLLVLKHGHHWRTCVPGIPELQTYDWLRVIAQDNSSIASIELWPDVDRYDLRLAFTSGEAWVIDIKNLTSPLGLKKTMAEQLPDMQRLRHLGELSWSRLFFVVPDYRERWGPGYVRAASTRTKDVVVTSMSGFRKILAKQLGQHLPKLA